MQKNKWLKSILILICILSLTMNGILISRGGVCREDINQNWREAM